GDQADMAAGAREPDEHGFALCRRVGRSARYLQCAAYACQRWSAGRRSAGLGARPPPPTMTAAPGRWRQLAFQAGGFFTSRHGGSGQFQRLAHEGIRSVTLTLEV